MCGLHINVMIRVRMWVRFSVRIMVIIFSGMAVSQEGLLLAGLFLGALFPRGFFHQSQYKAHTKSFDPVYSSSSRAIFSHTSQKSHPSSTPSDVIGPLGLH